MRKDGVAWDQRVEKKGKKSVKMEGKWKVAHLLHQFSPQQLWVRIYGKQVLFDLNCWPNY